MGGRMRLPAGRRILTWPNSGENLEVSDELAVSSSDSVFGFLESSPESSAGGDGFPEVEAVDEEEEERENWNSVEEKNFWHDQCKRLQETLYRTTSIETKIRNATREALSEAQKDGNFCVCHRLKAGTCRSCLMREVSSSLQEAGFNSAVCRTKWRSSPEIPAGEHMFIDVLDNSNPKKGETRVIIELNFKAGFEMARASKEYNQLINILPDVYVGKVERLRAMIKILGPAAKKCMRDKKMHMGPWRKQKYMQAKWFSSTCERITDAKASLDYGWQNKQTTTPARASVLTTVLLDMVPRMYMNEVAVL